MSFVGQLILKLCMANMTFYLVDNRMQIHVTLEWVQGCELLLAYGAFVLLETAMIDHVTTDHDELHKCFWANVAFKERSTCVHNLGMFLEQAKFYECSRAEGACEVAAFQVVTLFQSWPIGCYGRGLLFAQSLKHGKMYMLNIIIYHNYTNLFNTQIRFISIIFRLFFQFNTHCI